jgi:RNA polymerase sigma factor (sigma-70 family)
MDTVVRHLRQAALGQDGTGPTDGQLLECYLTHRDEAAFETLVRRHGPMVLGVCRRILRGHQDAEDAFQATFLVFVRKAASIVPREMVAGWLYGVAYQTAVKARAMVGKLRARERQVAAMPEPEVVPADAELWRDLRPILDEELSRLPDKYRVPILLCDLEDRPHKDVARQLGWPEGTLSGRLTRGRRMLAERLSRRGVVLSHGMLSALLVQNASASVPAAVVTSTVTAASLFAAGQAAASVTSATVAALTNGVLKAMMLTRVKMCVAVLLALGFLVSGVGLTQVPTTGAPEDKKPAHSPNDFDPFAAWKPPQHTGNSNPNSPADNDQRPLLERVKQLELRVAELERLLKGKAAADEPRKPTLTPPTDISGEVKKAEGGQILINIGSDAGVQKGHTLEIFRLGSKPQYLGTLTIVEVQPREAVGKPVGRLHSDVQPGDKVAAQLSGRVGN